MSLTSRTGPGQAEGDGEAKASGLDAAMQRQEPSASLLPGQSCARGHLSL